MKTKKGVVGFSVVFFLIISGCASLSGVTEQVTGGSGGRDMCAHDLDYRVVDVYQTQVQLWDREDGLYQVGDPEKQSLLQQYGGDSQGFCGVPVSEETQIVLDQAQSLADEGKEDEAKHKLENQIQLLNQVVGQVPAAAKLASLRLGSGKDATYSYVRDMLEIASQAQQMGMDDLSDSALEEATNTFDEYGKEAIENTTDLKDALEIAAQAQLLGLDELSDLALDKAREIAEKMIDEAFKNFSPCTATEEDVQELFRLAALGQLLGITEGERAQEALDYAKQWKEIQEKRERGEVVPECAGNYVELDEPFANGHLQVTGSVFTCDGTQWQVEVHISGTVDDAVITGEGLAEFTVTDGKSGEVILPIDGTVTFDEHTVKYHDPIKFGMRLFEDGQSVEISMGSTGEGTMSSPIGDIPYVALPGHTFNAPLEARPCN